MNSALQRARATLAALPEHQRPDAVDPENADLLASTWTRSSATT